ncbi:MAG: DUF917 domain-containing protein [Aigarchaeota archaeon]|nr:DUF917 domain-containing protein [Aigarchaeota archaeon]MCX8193061.1 DUF917 domain-containing protein [Nitrososphaeria archaeon]MDW7986910.1 DUF917 domain-containing protein [Nitrososphaerota archaeon]
MIEINSFEQIRDFVKGATILGTGGGGSPEEGLRILEKILLESKKIRLVDLSDIDRDSVIVVPYYVGTIAPEAKTKKPIKIEEPIKLAFREMERILGVKISAVLASELGGFNASLALYMGAHMNLPIIDGDLLGRAAPELHQCTVHIFGIPMYPSVIISETGNKVVVYEYSDIDDYEAIARYLSVLSGRFVAVVDTPLKVEDAEKVVIKNSMSLCLKIGEAIRLAKTRGLDIIEEVRKVLGGWKIFEGVVKSYRYRDEGGFLKGEALVEGVGKWRDKKLKTWIMNEHLMAWINGKPVAMAPDLIMFLNDEGEGITNTVLREGMKVNVLVAKSPEVWRTENGLKFFGPRRFGFDYDYVPVEELVEEIT